jgi:hypothetical protein
MKVIDVIANNCLHWLTEKQILAKIVELGINPNEEVKEGDKIKFGSMTFIAYDMGNAGRKSLEIAEDRPTQVVCPNCNGTGKIDATSI